MLEDRLACGEGRVRCRWSGVAASVGSGGRAGQGGAGGGEGGGVRFTSRTVVENPHGVIIRLSGQFPPCVLQHRCRERGGRERDALHGDRSRGRGRAGGFKEQGLEVHRHGRPAVRCDCWVGHLEGLLGWDWNSGGELVSWGDAGAMLVYCEC